MPNNSFWKALSYDNDTDLQKWKEIKDYFIVSMRRPDTIVCVAMVMSMNLGEKLYISFFNSRLIGKDLFNGETQSCWILVAKLDSTLNDVVSENEWKPCPSTKTYI